MRQLKHTHTTDFDDQNPKFLDEKYSLVMDDTQASLVGQSLRVLPRGLRAEDGDRGINAPILYSFDQLHSASGPQPAPGDAEQPEPAANIERYLHLNPASGELRLIRQWPAKWAAAPVTLVVRATQADNRDRYALTTLTIARGPSPAASQHQAAATAAPDEPRQNRARAAGIAFLQDRLTLNVPEDTPVSEKIGRVRAQYLGERAEAQQQQPDQWAGAQAADSQQVDLVVEHQQPAGANRSRTRVAPAGGEQAKLLRPISYQILDDHTDQFAINGLGEILLRRPLDYEQRQEFRFRVLATYTKHSDICQVQVEVANVNDNKPKVSFGAQVGAPGLAAAQFGSPDGVALRESGAQLELE